MQNLGIECYDIDSTERQLRECSSPVWVLILGILNLVILTVERTTFSHGLSCLDPIFTLQKTRHIQISQDLPRYPAKETPSPIT